MYLLLQIYDADVPLVLMNSFNTDEETHKIIKKYSGFRVRILTFNQSRYPRINRESLMPVAKDIRTERDIEAYGAIFVVTFLSACCTKIFFAVGILRGTETSTSPSTTLVSLTN